MINIDITYVCIYGALVFAGFFAIFLYLSQRYVDKRLSNIDARYEERYNLLKDRFNALQQVNEIIRAEFSLFTNEYYGNDVDLSSENIPGTTIEQLIRRKNETETLSDDSMR